MAWASGKTMEQVDKQVIQLYVKVFDISLDDDQKITGRNLQSGVRWLVWQRTVMAYETH